MIGFPVVLLDGKPLMIFNTLLVLLIGSAIMLPLNMVIVGLDFVFFLSTKELLCSAVTASIDLVFSLHSQH